MVPMDAAVAVIVYGPDKTVLLVMDTDRRPPHYWKFPGGRVEAGERLTEAAVREIKEETGVTLREEALDLVLTELRKGDELRAEHEFHLFVTSVDSYQGLQNRGETGEFTKLWLEAELENLPDFHKRHLQLLYSLNRKSKA